MSFRNKLLLVLAATVLVTVLAVSVSVAGIARSAFDRQDQARSQAIAAQFRREFDHSGDDVVRRVSAAAASDSVRRIALDSARAKSGAYIGEAAQLITTHGLDFLDLVTADGSIISSAEFPARFGYRDEWATSLGKLAGSGASLRRQELPNGSVLGIFAVRAVPGGEQPLYVIGGLRLDPQFINALAMPADSSAELVTSPQGSAASESTPELKSLQAGAVKSGEETAGIDESAARTLHVLPLKGPSGEVLAALIISTSRQDLERIQQYIRSVALVVAGVGIVLAILVSGWIATRVTRPVEQLAAGASRVASGDWSARVDVRSSDEFGQLADAFNRMTSELINQRDRLVQAERVAAWRELARRLAHELKNPLFPLQITVENLVRARELPEEEFDEVFRESTGTLLGELENLRRIVGRFSDFSKMPKPQLERVSLNPIVEQVAKTHEAQLATRGTVIGLNMQLDPDAPVLEADPTLLHRAVSNLVLNAIDAMPGGGALTLRTRGKSTGVEIEVSDTGTGMTQEERERLFTPYYTTKQHGTGLGLAIVQSVISDHHGKITVESGAGSGGGTTFRIELPLTQAKFQTQDTGESTESHRDATGFP